MINIERFTSLFESLEHQVSILVILALSELTGPHYST